MKDWERRAEKEFKGNKKFLERLKKNPPRDLDRTFQEAHEEIFSAFDCLHCANCCKTISPVFKMKDIERIADYVKKKPADFIDTYLKMDEEGDYVLQKSPCAFLNEDNTCQVYEVRPAACRSYPHTDRSNIQSLLNLTLRNTKSCPATLEIVALVKKKYE